MTGKLKVYWNDFLDLLFPRFCEACEQALQGQEKVLCTTCHITLPKFVEHDLHYEAIQKRFAAYPEVKSVQALWVFTKKGKVQRLIYGLKYRHRKEIGILAGQLFAQLYTSPTADYIIPVPLHKRRLKERGYNQSELFSEGLSSIWQIPCVTEVLLRQKYTTSQTGKSKEERAQNVDAIFEVTQSNLIVGKSIVLTDDVLTTGATLESCIATLVANQCKEIHIITIAVAHH
jgi:ComF family protein